MIKNIDALVITRKHAAQTIVTVSHETTIRIFNHLTNPLKHSHYTSIE